MDALIQFLLFTLALRFLTWDELSTRASTENYDNIRSRDEPKSVTYCPNFGITRSNRKTPKAFASTRATPAARQPALSEAQRNRMGPTVN
jgi:hypothetical protein